MTSSHPCFALVSKTHRPIVSMKRQEADKQIRDAGSLTTGADASRLKTIIVTAGIVAPAAIAATSMTGLAQLSLEAVLMGVVASSVITAILLTAVTVVRG